MALLTIPLSRNVGVNYFFTYFILNIGVNGHNPITYIQTPFSTIEKIFALPPYRFLSFSYFFCVSEIIQLLKVNKFDRFRGNYDELHNFPTNQEPKGGLKLSVS